MQRFAVRTVSGAIAVVAVGAMLAGPVAVADPVPELWLTYSQLYLGSSTEAAGTGLAPSAAYQLSVDSGGLGPSQLPTVDLTTSTLGRFSVAYVLGATRPAPTAVHFTLTTPGDPTPAAVLSVDVHPPWLYYGRACPGQSVPVTVMGLVDGNYSITASDPDVAAVETTGDDLRSSRASFPLPARIPADFTLSVLDEQSDDVVVSEPVAMDQPIVQTVSGLTPWRQVLAADCFAPGEHVSWNAVPGTSAPVVTANSHGSATLPVTMHPAQQPVTTPPLGATGEVSGQRAEFAPVLIAGTTLLVGHSLGPDIRPLVLASAAPPPTAGYSFQTNGGNLAILHDGQPYWFSRSFLASCSCVLTMQSDGNLVYRTPAGTAVWSTGTAKTGSNNRLIIGGYGNLVLRTVYGDPLWTNAVGLIRGTNGYTSQVLTDGYRDYATVYVWGHVNQRKRTGALGYSAYRRVYLQRHQDGHWVNVLARSADSTGHFKFVFVQPKGFSYRLLATKSATAAAAYSKSFYR